MPVLLPTAARNALSRSLLDYSDRIGTDIVQQALDGIYSILNPGESETGATTGDSPSTLDSRLSSVLRDYGTDHALADELNLPFKIKVATEVAQGASRLVAQNFDQEELDAYPALQFHRVYDRNVPRGLKVGPKGTLIAVPDDNWPSRWAAAGEDCGDDGWLPWEGDAQGGRGVALKSSGIWESLGDGAGGYDDTLGNPYPPFAFNSGFDVDGVSRNETEELGLLDAGEPAQRAPVDFASLFSFA